MKLGCYDQPRPRKRGTPDGLPTVLSGSAKMLRYKRENARSSSSGRREILLINRGQVSLLTWGPAVLAFCARASAFFRAGRGEFIRRKFAVAVLIQSKQGLGCVGDLVRVNHAVTVDIQRLHHRVCRTMASRSFARAAGSAFVDTIMVRRRILSIGALAITLRRTGSDLVVGQLAIAIDIELLENGGGGGEFGCVDHPVVVGIESGDEGRRRAVMASCGTMVPRRWAVMRGSAFRTGSVLSGDCEGHGTCECGDDCFGE